MADKVAGALNDSMHSSLSMVVGKFAVLEGQIGSHLSATRHFVDNSMSQLRDLSLAIGTGVNKLTESKLEHDRLINALKGVVGKVPAPSVPPSAVSSHSSSLHQTSVADGPVRCMP